MPTEYDLLAEEVALGRVVRALPPDARRRVDEIVRERPTSMRKALPPPPRAQPAPPRGATLPAKPAPLRATARRPAPDAVDRVFAQIGEILDQVPERPGAPRMGGSRRPRAVTEPAEVMRALDQLAARMPPPKPGDRGDDDARRRLGTALGGILGRALAAQREGALTAHDVAAIELRVNLLRRRAGLRADDGGREP